MGLFGGKEKMVRKDKPSVDSVSQAWGVNSENDCDPERGKGPIQHLKMEELEENPVTTLASFLFLHL